MTQIDFVREKIQKLYQQNRKIHIIASFESSSEKIEIPNAKITHVYSHLFQVEELSSGTHKKHTWQYADVITKNVLILELEPKKFPIVAEQLEKRKKKAQLISDLNACFEADYFFSKKVFNSHRNERLITYDEFSQLRAQFVSNWFSKHIPSISPMPDKHQLTAIAATEQNVEVVARAGSGKTATIVNRVRFLIEHCHVDPSTLLLLAFNKKAAKELSKKVEDLLSSQCDSAIKKPHVMTFHALAYSIVHPTETLIFDNEELGAKTLSFAIQGIIDEHLRDDRWISKIQFIMFSYFKDDWDEISKMGRYLSKKEQIEYRRSLPKLTLDGKYVKSYGEKVIANILFEYNVDYQYKKSCCWIDGSPYRPDFTICLPDGRRLVIEYFGLKGDPSYDSQIVQKKEYWTTQRDAEFLEVYEEDVSFGEESLVETILTNLKSHGIKVRKLSENEIWEKIKDRAIDHFTGAIKNFVGRCRKKDLSIENLIELVARYESDNESEKKFLEIAVSIYKEYLEKLSVEKLEDFDGLLSRATLKVESGVTSFDAEKNRDKLERLTFIMIDEYQDFSMLFDRFLGAIRRCCPQAGVFCVGDDWQAINAFAGSDVQYFQKFTTNYTSSNRYTLNTNYRSKREIVSIGQKLMCTERESAPIYAAKIGYGNVLVASLSDFSPSPEEKLAHESDTFTPAILRLVTSFLKQGKRVIMLARTNDRLPFYYKYNGGEKVSSLERFLETIRSFLPNNQKGQVNISTVHKYKGKEEDAVIVLDAVIRFYPFIHPAWIFQRVFGDTLEKLIEDERRLFYVAVSRAKDDLILLTNSGEESPFLREIGTYQHLNWNDYAPCKTGITGIRVEVTNQPKYNSSATFAIKDTLKKEFLYQWDPLRSAWCKLYTRDEFNIDEVLNEAWTKAAHNIVLTLYDESDESELVYVFEHGIARLKQC